MVMPLLARRMPMQKARWLALSGRSLKASEASRIGLVDTCVEGPIELEMTLRSTLKQLLRASPRAIARLKSFTDAIEGAPTRTALEAGAQRTAQDLLELETISAIRGFLAGDRPAWFERYKAGQKTGDPT
jgi:methylglutaconyl-CoA hydratase/polyketide biosynthesis enoyl-CoA hydratase PksH